MKVTWNLRIGARNQEIPHSLFLVREFVIFFVGFCVRVGLVITPAASSFLVVKDRNNAGSRKNPQNDFICPDVISNWRAGLQALISGRFIGIEVQASNILHW